MRVDMLPILNGKTDRIEFAFAWEGASEYFADVSFSGPVAVHGSVINRSGYMFLTLHADVGYDTCCARCLSPIHRDLSLDLEKNVASKGSLDPALEAEGDYLLIEKNCLFPDEAVAELLFLELPSRDLCREDCPGLCPKCGKRLADGPCGCSEKEIDPRLAVLAHFLKETKE